MTYDTIQGLLRHQPFEPFTVRTSGGQSYQISHPELAMLTKNNLYIAEPDSDRVITCALLHISSVERIEMAQSGR